jgi:hypothetical protein
VERLFLQQEEAEKSRVVANPRLQPLKLQNKSVVANRDHRSAPKITIALWLQRLCMKSNKRIPLSTEFAEFKLGRFAGSKSLALDWHRY